MAEAPLRVAFVHPEMGLGGAERWVADAATALRSRGHRVAIWTCSFDQQRCFEPLKSGALDVGVRAGWAPSSIAGRLRAPCNVFRVGALSWLMARARADYDVIVADLVSHTLPLLRSRARLPIGFYCHYPDLLLAPRRRGIYRAYRAPIDWLESRGLAAADRVWVNSAFTARQFGKTFPQLEAPAVLYPAVAMDEAAKIPEAADDELIRLLALGRFDPAKNLELAVETFAALKAQLPRELAARLRLQLAGGLDRKRPEAVEAVQRLRRLAAERGVAGELEILPNPDDARRWELLRDCRCVLYTPRREHFGLVPLEAMAAGRPVVAVNEGGPLETIVDAVSGKLRPPAADAFAEAVAEWVIDVAAARSCGAAGRLRAREFSLDRLGESLEGELLSLLPPRG